MNLPTIPPSINGIEAAQQIVYQAMPPTPQYSWPLLNQRLGIQAFIKHENHSPVGAFKLRGALKEKESLNGKSVGIVLTGGNIDRELYAQVLEEAH